MIQCDHWRDVGLVDAGGCAIGKFGGRPSRGTCHACLGLSVTPSSSREIKPPALHLTQAQQQMIVVHKRICSACDHHKRFTRLTVHCTRCGCAGLSLLKGPCPMKKW